MPSFTWLAIGGRRRWLPGGAGRNGRLRAGRGGRRSTTPAAEPGRAPTSRAELVLGERAYAVGDEVLALRRLGSIPSATGGTVVAVEPQLLTVEWRCPSGTARTVVGHEHAKSLGYGYATTVPYLRSWPTGPGGGPGTAEAAPLFVLGDPLQLGSRASLAGPAWVTVAGPGMPAPGPGGATARYRAAIAELATSWPDKEMLDRAGPRPLNAAAHRRWAELVANCALERQVGLTRGAGGPESMARGDGRDRTVRGAARAGPWPSPSPWRHQDEARPGVGAGKPAQRREDCPNGLADEACPTRIGEPFRVVAGFRLARDRLETG